MKYFLSIILLSSGFTVLFLGGELLVRSSLNLAKKWQLSSLFIGLTLVSIGTSAPELFASLAAAIENKPDIALGNIIGSNIFNLLMILGLTALIQPLIIQKSLMKCEWVFLFLSASLLTLSLKNASLIWYEGLFFLILFFVFLFFSFYQAKKKSPIQPTEKNKFKKSTEIKIKKKQAFSKLHDFKNQVQSFSKKYFYCFHFLILFFGILLLSIGAKIALMGAISLGRNLGISETIIGIVIISIGTGLPELVTSTVAALKSENDLAISNVIGSNLMNTLGITSVLSLIKPIHLEENLLFQESLMMLGITFLFFPIAWITKFEMKKKTGLFLLFVYATYLWTLF